MRRPKSSVWSIACAHHVYLNTDFYFGNVVESVPLLFGRTAKDTISRWMKGNDVIVMDTVSWPKNYLCAYIKSV